MFLSFQIQTPNNKKVLVFSYFIYFTGSVAITWYAFLWKYAKRIRCNRKTGRYSQKFFNQYYYNFIRGNSWCIHTGRLFSDLGFHEDFRIGCTIIYDCYRGGINICQNHFLTTINISFNYC